MTSKYALRALLVVAFVAPSVFAEEAKLTNLMNCLTMESVKTIMETSNVTIPACVAEVGPSTRNAAAEAATTGTPTREAKNPEAILCLMECFYRTIGLVKDGSFVIEDFAKGSVKPEHQENLTSSFHSCLSKEGLSTNYTANRADQCKSFEKYDKCMDKVAKVCRAKSSSS